jgi:hypothetical protein
MGTGGRCNAVPRGVLLRRKGTGGARQGCTVALPRSNVIPRSLLCGFLSNALVDATVLMARADGSGGGGENVVVWRFGGGGGWKAEGSENEHVRVCVCACACACVCVHLHVCVAVCMSVCIGVVVGHPTIHATQHTRQMLQPCHHQPPTHQVRFFRCRHGQAHPR